nr:basic proline-rich protein-like [Odocoileus virginianus texanus]
MSPRRSRHRAPGGAPPFSWRSPALSPEEPWLCPRRSPSLLCPGASPAGHPRGLSIHAGRLPSGKSTSAGLLWPPPSGVGAASEATVTARFSRVTPSVRLPNPHTQTKRASRTASSPPPGAHCTDPPAAKPMAMLTAPVQRGHGAPGGGGGTLITGPCAPLGSGLGPPLPLPPHPHRSPCTPLPLGRGVTRRARPPSGFRGAPPSRDQRLLAGRPLGPAAGSAPTGEPSSLHARIQPPGQQDRLAQTGPGPPSRSGQTGRGVTGGPGEGPAPTWRVPPRRGWRKSPGSRSAPGEPGRWPESWEAEWPPGSAPSPRSPRHGPGHGSGQLLCPDLHGLRPPRR